MSGRNKAHPRSCRILLIVNAKSGGGRSIDMLPSVESRLTELGAEVDVRITDSPGEATAVAWTASRCGYDRVAAIGGDGTINSVGAGILGSEATLAVVPAGQGNDYFKMLGIKNDLDSICQAVVFGDEALLDVGMINGRPFFNTLGIGFDAEVAIEVNKRSRNLGKLTYLSAVLRTWKRNPAFDLKLRIDSLELKYPVLMVSVGIGRCSGGGFYLTPQAIVNDGKFDVCILAKVGRSKIFSLLPRTIKGTHVRQPQVKIYRCKKVEIFSEKPLPVHYEGETLTADNGRITIDMCAEKLKVATSPKRDFEV